MRSVIFLLPAKQLRASRITKHVWRHSDSRCSLYWRPSLGCHFPCLFPYLETSFATSGSSVILTDLTFSKLSSSTGTTNAYVHSKSESTLFIYLLCIVSEVSDMLLLKDVEKDFLLCGWLCVCLCPLYRLNAQVDFKK